MAKKCKTEWRPEYDRDYHAVRDGMNVCGADGDVIGEVSKIYAGPGEEKAHILVKKGAVVKKDLYVPLEAVKAVDRDNVFLECPTGQCGEKGWDEAPSGAEEKVAVWLDLGEQSPDVYPNVAAGAGSPKNIVETAIAAGSFTTLVAAVKAAGLVDTLSGPGPFTVFAPTDEAFAKLPAGTVEALLTDVPKLTSILTYHVVPGKVMAGDVMSLTEAATVNGQKLPIDTSRGVMVGNANVVKTDIEASNGVIHVIDNVLLPS
jgi:uncharacterized surface protein with fasciclin (FAS1) repeats